MDLTRRHWIGMTSAVAVGAGAVARLPAEPPAVQLIRRGAKDPAPLLASLSRYAAAEMASYGLPGMTLALIGPDGLEARMTLGYADLERRLPVRPDHLFQIGSISKSMVALCLYRLADAGKLDLDAPAASILPDLPWPDAAITVAMLVNHTAALSDFSPLFPRSPGGRLWTNYPPGTRFSYSNPGYEILGRIVAQASGMPYHKALQTMVLRPLGMVTAEPLILTRDRARYPVGYLPFGDGAYFPDSPLAQGTWMDIETPAGSVAATSADMARFMTYLVALGRGEGAPLLSDAMARRYVTTTTDAADFKPKGRYAAGIATIEIDGRRLLHHTGGMILYHSSLTVDPEAGGGVFASVNSGAGDYRPRGITNYGCRLLRAFAEGKPLPGAPKITPVPPIPQIEDRAGRFVAANGDTITISAEGGGLAVEADGLRGRLQLAGEERFASDHPRLKRHEILYVGGRKDRLWWGGTLYGRGAAVPTPPPAEPIAALAGLYLSNDPWNPVASIVVRGNELVLEGAGPLSRAPDGSWRMPGEEPSPERLWFEAPLSGRPQRLVFSGVDLRRFHDLTD